MTKQEFRKQLKEVVEDWDKYVVSTVDHDTFNNWLIKVMPIGEEKVEQWSADKLIDNDDYWYITDEGEVAETSWANWEEDKYRLKSGNIYQTQKLAQEAYNKIMSK